jgi:hypothetical protein
VPPLKILDLVFLWVPPLLQAALAVVLLCRRLHKQFPVFFVYTSYSVVAGVLQVSTIHRDVLYFWVYWITQLIYCVLALIVLQEIFRRAWNLKRWHRRLAVLALLLIVACLSTLWGWQHPVGRGRLAGLNAFFIAFVVQIGCIQAVAFVAALRLIRKLTTHEIGITLGFALISIAGILAYPGRYYFGARFKEVFFLGPPTAYLAATGVWLGVFLWKPKLRIGSLDLEKEAKKYAWYAELLAQYNEWAEKISKSLGLRWPGKKKNSKKPDEPNREYASWPRSRSKARTALG